MPNVHPDPEDAYDHDPLHNLGPDSTATFDGGPSNPTERAGSEATLAATSVERDNSTADHSDMRVLHTADAAAETDEGA